jgi:CheY-like chemotaxis protein
LKTVKVAACCVKPVRQSALFDCIVQALNGTSRTEPHQRESVPRPEISAPTRPERILLAEDNVVNQQVALGNLHKLGFSADLATNGLEVLDILETRQYDIILMDCQMPELDGYEVTREIRRREGSARHAWIIAMTANVMVGDKEKCLEAGMDDYVGKPLRRAELSAALERGAKQEKNPIDQKFVDTAIIDDREGFEELIGLFASSAPASIIGMRRALEQSDAKALSMAAHTLKGSCSNMGASPLRDICAQLELLAGHNNLNGTQDLVASAEKELERLIETLKTYRKNECPD